MSEKFSSGTYNHIHSNKQTKIYTLSMRFCHLSRDLYRASLWDGALDLRTHSEIY